MSESKENIFLFVPNIIGFGRVILAIISFYFMPTHCVLACVTYITSALLDAIDGHAARYFNQSTKFGAILDQLTDRAGTACLMMTLATFYPQYTFWFQISMAIDITCHWLYLHTTTLQGKASHKFIDMSENPVMRIYYTNKMVLFAMCAGNEAFYAALYVMYFYSGPTVYCCVLINDLGQLHLMPFGQQLPTFPTRVDIWQAAGHKTIDNNFYNMYYERLHIVSTPSNWDKILGIGLYKLIAIVSAPVAIVKAAISVLQGVVGAINLATIDVNERAALADKQKN